MRKYGNVKVKIDNHTFDSKMEADYYYYLKVKKSKNEIKSFTVHPTIVVQDSFKFKGKTVKAITYTPDFVVHNIDGTIDFIDVKGVKTQEFRIKEKMLKYLYRNVSNYDVYCITLVGETWVRI